MADAESDRSDPRVLRARTLRREATPAERVLWRALRQLDLPIGHFRRQVPMGPYFADFAHHGLRLMIELDGAPHSHDRRQQRDSARSAVFEGFGYRVLRFWNEEVRTNRDGVVDTILAAIPPGPLPTPNPSLPRAGGGGCPADAVGRERSA